MTTPPPLPPRSSETYVLSQNSSQGQDPRNSQDTDGSDLLASPGVWARDPRTSSTQSLVPSIPEQGSNARRTLLVIYIHGFYGNDQSFRSFPAHVHSFLGSLLSDSHVIHSKIYPRYKTYKAIEIARDNFSAWLEPHESLSTDVVLVGHSMGGLLAGEVALVPNQNPYKQQRFKHKIVGTLSLDSPFLGLHPGIVVSGIASLFQPASPPPASPDAGECLNSPPSYYDSTSSVDRVPSISSQIQPSEHASSSSQPSLQSPPHRQPTDPYFDPPFHNDAPFREQPFVKRLMHFASKHKSEGLFNAVSNHVSSHLEFGGCLADYPGMRARYNKLRALEDVDEVKAMTEGHPPGAYARVRFVNYYTLSPGRPKAPKLASEGSNLQLYTTQTEASPTQHSLVEESTDLPPIQLADSSGGEQQSDQNKTPQIAVQPPDIDCLSPDNNLNIDEKTKTDTVDADNDEIHEQTINRTSMLSMQDVDPLPMSDDDIDIQPKDAAKILEGEQSQPASDNFSLPPIPDAPEEPELPDLSRYTDKDAKKQAEKESKRLQKAYEQALKDRNKAIREREKLLEKRRKNAQKQADKREKDAQKEHQRLDKEMKKLIADEEAKGAKEAAAVASSPDTTPNTSKPKKLRKFCSLPSKSNGVRDSTWVDVYMEDMDEVTAHCALFFPGPHYDKLVGDVGARIAGWVHDDMTARALLSVD